MPHSIHFSIIIALILSGCSSDVAPPISQNAAAVLTPAYDTPEATFAAAKAAVQSKDYEAFCDCWSPDGLTWLSGGMAMVANMYRAMADREIEKKSDKAIEMKERKQQLTELLTKHGFPNGVNGIDAIVGTMNIQIGDGHSQEDVDRQVREQLTTIAEPITDQTAFMVEMYAFMELISNRPDFSMLPSDAEFAEAVIDGDRATATINKKIADSVRPCPAILERINEEWKFVEIKGLMN